MRIRHVVVAGVCLGASLLTNLPPASAAIVVLAAGQTGTTDAGTCGVYRVSPGVHEVRIDVWGAQGGGNGGLGGRNGGLVVVQPSDLVQGCAGGVPAANQGGGNGAGSGRSSSLVSSAFGTHTVTSFGGGGSTFVQFNGTLILVAGGGGGRAAAGSFGSFSPSLDASSTPGPGSGGSDGSGSGATGSCAHNVCGVGGGVTPGPTSGTTSSTACPTTIVANPAGTGAGYVECNSSTALFALGGGGGGGGVFGGLGGGAFFDGATGTAVAGAGGGGTGLIDSSVKQSFFQTGVGTGGGRFTVEALAAPVASISGPGSVSEGAGSASYTVSLDRVSALDQSVPWSLVAGSALVPDDVKTRVGAQSPLVIPAGQQSGTITVDVVDDDVYEPSAESFQVSLGANGDGVTGSPSSVTTSITENDPRPVVTLTGASSLGESVGTVTYTAHLSRPSAQVTQVAVQLSGGTATVPDDVALSSAATVQIPAGQTDGTFTAAVVDDALNEADETYRVAIVSAQGADVGTPGSVDTTIVDNDLAPEVTIGSPGSSPESVGTLFYPVKLSAPSGRETTVACSVQDGTARSPGDVEVLSPIVTIPAGETISTCRVRVVDDALHEHDETLTAVLSSPQGAALGTPSTWDTTIIDDDPLPVVTISGPVSVGEAQAEVVYPVSLDAPSGLDTAVGCLPVGGTAPGHAQPGIDFLQLTLTLVIPAGSTQGSCKLSTIDDRIYEGDEVFSMTLVAPRGATLGTPSSVETTIVDNEPQPKVSISGPGSVDEGSSASYTVTLDAVAPTEVVATVKVVPGSASVDDVVETGGTVNIAAGSTQGVFVVHTVGDALHEASESYSVEVSSVSGAVLGTPASATTSIVDDDPLPVVTISGPASVGEGARNLVYPVSLDAPSGLDTTVGCAVAGGTTAGNAQPGVDFVQESGTIVIPAGSTHTACKVSTLEDSTYEGDEVFSVGLASPHGATLGTPSSVTTTIVDNDPLPKVSISGPVSVDEGKAASYTVTLGALPSGLDTSVSWSLSAGSAVVPGDVGPVSGSVVVKAGERSATFSVSTVDDSVYEGDETYSVGLSSPVGATLGTPSSVTTRIVDDDPLPQVSLGGPVSVGEAVGTAVYTVGLSSVSTGPVVVPVSLVSGSATVGVDAYSLVSSVTIPAGQRTATFAVTIVNDLLQERSEDYRVVLGAPSGPAELGPPSWVETTIADNDDRPGLELSGIARVAEGAGVVTYTAVLSTPALSDVTVPWSVSGGSASVPGDVGPASGSVVIRAGQLDASFTVSVVDDAVVEGDESFTVTLGASSPAVPFGPTHAITTTITDDDTAGPPPATPVVSISDASVVEGTGGTTVATVTVSLDHASSVPVTVRYATRAGTATAGADYRAARGVVTIPAGQTTATVQIVVVADTIAEPDERFQVVLSRPTGAVLSSARRAWITITDDDHR